MRSRRCLPVSSTVPWVACLLAVLLGCSCGSMLRSAAHEHARASLATAQTLERAAASLQCGGLPPDAAAECRLVTRVISEQAQALRDSAARLERSAY